LVDQGRAQGPRRQDDEGRAGLGPACDAMTQEQPVTVIGGGLAGCSAALLAAERGTRVILYEQRPGIGGELHDTHLLGELVGSNDVGPERADRASGLLRLELRELECVTAECLEQARLGEARSLVDGGAFARLVTETVEQHEGIELRREQAPSLAVEGVVVVATGPTTWSPLARSIYQAAGEPFSFAFWGRSPVIHAERLGQGQGAWLPPYPGADPLLFVPLSDDEVDELAQRVSDAERAEPPGLSEAVLADMAEPVERVIHDEPSRFRRRVLRAPRASDAVAGDGAALRLRPDGTEHTYHIEDFVTALTPDAQRHALEAVGALSGATVVRPGMIARAPHLAAARTLLPTLQMKRTPRVLVAGLLAGVSGYWETLATPVVPPPETMTGALCRALTGQASEEPTPLAAGFGLLPGGPETTGLSKKERRARQVEIAVAAMKEFMAQVG